MLSFYSIEEVRKYISDIRLLLTQSVEELTDMRALEIIEDYVFSKERANACSYGENSALIERLFFSLRCEMDLYHDYSIKAN